MALTDLEIRKIQPGQALTKLSDGGGLQLWVMPDGAKRWRLASTMASRRPSLSACILRSACATPGKPARTSVAGQKVGEGRKS